MPSTTPAAAEAPAPTAIGTSNSNPNTTVWNISENAGDAANTAAKEKSMYPLTVAAWNTVANIPISITRDATWV